MSELDPMVSALIALCKTEGGYKTVADNAKISPDNLWQIVSGIKLPSGNPRGVGPNLRAKISAAYPGWLSTGEGPKHPATLPAVYQPNQPKAPIPLAGRTMDLESTITALRAHIRASGADADAVAVLLAAVARNPDDERPAQALHIMLDTAFAQPGKNKAQA